MSDSKGIKIIQTVASGGTAVLFKAVQTSLDRIVAVKRLHRHLTDDENFTRRFILEAKAAASLDHPNIVRVIDFGQEEDSYQMVMEFVEGESLKDVLERWRPIKYDLALAIVYQILLGLEHAHAKGIVHRDIKPGNVMLTTAGKVKIADFGLAKLTQAATSQTAANSILGTPLYMSPEQAFGESVDQRSDLFSLGTVLYELLTGRQPFASENYMGVIQNILNLEIPSVTDLHSEIPDEVEAIVETALSKDRDERFQSARHFREALEDYLGIERLGQLSESLTVLLESNTNTAVLPNPNMTPRPRKRKSSAGGVFALFMFLILGGASAALILKPEWRDQLSVLLATKPDTSSVQQATPNDYNFDMGTLVDDREPKRDTVVVLQRVVAEPPAPDTVIVEKEPEEKPKPKPQPVVREGFLHVGSDPPAEVWVDGVYKGDAPVRLTLKAGQHSVECKHPHYETYREVLRIVNGELSRRNVIMKKLRGNLSLTTQADSDIYVDGKLVGRTPLRKPLVIDVGPHTVTIKKAGFHTWTNKVTVEANKTLPLNITLSPQY